MFEGFDKIKDKAMNGDTNAQYAMGKMHKEGYDAPLDYEEAFKWYMKAAIKGHTGAQCYVGWLYENGFGVPPDKKLAIEWYTRGGAHKKLEYLKEK